MERGTEKNNFLDPYFKKEKEKNYNLLYNDYHNLVEITNEQNKDKTLYIFGKQITKENENPYRNNGNKDKK